jgi:tetratricopeptide (TPR) repeat protein
MNRLIIVALLLAAVTNLEAQMLKKPTSKNAERRDMLVAKSDSALYANDFKKMRKINKKIAKIVTPDYAGFVYVQYGWVLLTDELNKDKKDNVNRAIKEFKRAIKLYSSSQWGYLSLGNVYYKLGVEAMANANELPTEQYNAEREKAKAYFRQALPLIEKADKIDKSEGHLIDDGILQLLRTIYYNLEMNDNFFEIERLIEESNQ